jgi:hypothetical protein
MVRLSASSLPPVLSQVPYALQTLAKLLENKGESVIFG